ncbi:hypothetical protein AMTR_s00006p00071950 [Amborella trichopoda]|uniref:Uncharacterized protein n=1 Tax=Amborella trichopoda TaxID=13333 RepID=W1P6W1_AMBTC|nr:hypothetical protein AMTR_s00006p00071950 [Amborella trichopoda]
MIKWHTIPLNERFPANVFVLTELGIFSYIGDDRRQLYLLRRCEGPKRSPSIERDTGIRIASQLPFMGKSVHG